ncbi:hypothetical protein GOODEAATRI_028581 [Goodea atripinnis]|uniref:Uncharacterized protein n=1 Tax=Goodea atripinnis TaxID=208336 RepID=A0ABV0MLG9_9TELE
MHVVASSAGGLYEGGSPALLRLSALTTAACKLSSMLEILLEPPTTNLDFSPGSLLPGSRSCVPSSLIVFDLPALPRDHQTTLPSCAAVQPQTRICICLPPDGSIPA